MLTRVVSMDWLTPLPIQPPRPLPLGIPLPEPRSTSVSASSVFLITRSSCSVSSTAPHASFLNTNSVSVFGLVLLGISYIVSAYCVAPFALSELFRQFSIS